MTGMFHGINLFPLQYVPNVQFYKTDDPKSAIYVLIGAAVIVLVVIVVNLIRTHAGASVVGKGKAGTSPRRFSALTLHKVATTYGLDREQTKLLEYVFRTNSVNDPERVVKNPALLDRQFKRTYKLIERNSQNEEDRQQRLVRLFTLRNLIEAAPDTDTPAAGQIASNTAAVLVADKESYPVRVISSQGLNVAVDTPRNALGTPIRLSRGTKVSLSFFTKSIKGFSYEGHVAGTQETEHGAALIITRTGKATPLVKRKYRRKPTAIRCMFSLVFLDDEEGKKKTTKLVVDKKRFNGSVLDLSVGGCSIKTNANIQVGSRLKISIDYDENYLITVLGQVLRANRSGPAANIIHIKFLKVPRRAFNSINALVFGFDED
ncbi:MAG: PilZ domain-containing protein [Treponema sp.]|nr:PilZ domain-containing protein [Treponema sp.]